MNKIIIVTGGAAGIGRCIVEYFAVEGDHVYFIDNNRKATIALVERMRQQGYTVTGFVGDVAEKQVLEHFVQMILDEQPQGIHCLINNACLMHGGILGGCDYEDFLYIQRIGVAASLPISQTLQKSLPRHGIHRKHLLNPRLPVAAKHRKLHSS